MYALTVMCPEQQHAHAAEDLLPFLKPGARVLDVGSGSGYLAAVFYHLIQDPADPKSADGKVVGIEHIPELVEWSIENLRKDKLGPALDEGKIQMIAGDGRKGSTDSLLSKVKSATHLLSRQARQKTALSTRYTLVPPLRRCQLRWLNSSPARDACSSLSVHTHSRSFRSTKMRVGTSPKPRCWTSWYSVLLPSPPFALLMRLHSMFH